MILERLSTCAYPRCKKEIPNSFLVCNRHWECVPPEKRYKIVNQLVRELEDDASVDIDGNSFNLEGEQK